MKFIFFVLFSFNVVFFLAEFHKSERAKYLTDAAIEQSEDPSIERIVLLQERPEDSSLAESAAAGQQHSREAPYRRPDKPEKPLPAAEPEAPETAQASSDQATDFATTASAPNPADADRTDAESPQIESEPELSGYSTDPAEDVTEPEEDATDPIGISLPAPAEASPVERPPESDSSVAGQSVEETEPVITSDPNELAESTESPPRLCYKLGPRFTRRSFYPISAQLKQSGSTTTIRSEAVDKQTGFMVFYQAAETIEDSRDNLAELRSKGLRDLWLIEKGVLRGGISLGIFNSREPAERMQAELKAKQIETAIKPKLSKRTGYFLYFESEASVESMQLQLAQSGFENKELIQIDRCEF